MDVPKFIENHEAVLSHFGRWPSFHDANVVSYHPAAPESDVILLTLHGWNMTNQIDEKGYFVLKDHALVTFRFEQTSDRDMDVFADKNILFGMHLISDSSSSTFAVELDSVMDMSGSFRARRGAVISVVPCSPEGRPT